MKFNTKGLVYNLNTKQNLPINVQEAWEFLSDPRNLQRITPKNMEFEIISGDEKKMFPGQIIQYKIRLAPGIRISWVTEITHVNDLNYFVDEQRFGPYKFWHHKHYINPTDDGVELEDSIDYIVPGGPFRRWIHVFFVKPKLMEIFSFRRKILSEIIQKSITKAGN